MLSKPPITSVLNIVSNRHKFHPNTSIPDLNTKVILVTGGNNGAGKESVLQLAKHHPSRLYLAARSKLKFDNAVTDILKVVPDAKIDFLELDLASLASVKRAADTVLAANTRLDILLNNAGVMGLPPGLTEDGYEIQFGTNHMGHALLTKLLMPLLLKTVELSGADVRIINLTSIAEMTAPKGGFLPDRVTTTMQEYRTYTRYGQSKLANLLFTRSLALKYPTITSVAIHPGRVRTNLLTNFFSRGGVMSLFLAGYDFLVIMPVEKGAMNQLWAATGEKEVVKTGTYYAPIGREGGESRVSKDPKLAEKLWQWQEAEFTRLGY
jgi:NAD(P)-dependent dehydrogenase (short-subunit alcohol dehydrogenase family)